MGNANQQKEITLGAEGGQIASFLSPNDMKAGQELSGTYLGSFQCGPYKTFTHKIETADGVIGVNGSGMLNKKLALVTQGADVTIVYTGKQPIAKGPFAGTNAHQFKVLVNSDNADGDDDL